MCIVCILNAYYESGRNIFEYDQNKVKPKQNKINQLQTTIKIVYDSSQKDYVNINYAYYELKKIYQMFSAVGVSETILTIYLKWLKMLYQGSCAYFELNKHFIKCS